VYPLDDGAATLIGSATVVFGYIVFGLTGFGASLLTVPVLSHFFPLPLVLALAAVLDLAAGAVVGVHGRREAALAELHWLVPFSLVGAALGVSLLVSLPSDLTLLALGGFIAAYGLHQASWRVPQATISRAWAPLAGLLGGATGTLFGVGGPAYLIYLMRRIEDKGRLRATMGVMVWFSLAIRLIVFGIAGVLLQPGLALGLVWFLPAALLGLWLGHRIHLRTSTEAVLKLLYLLLIVCGGSLVARALLTA